MFVILLLVLQIILGNVESSFVQRIVGGYNASIEDFPFIVAIYANGDFHCGGSIIAPDIIVTAAHCVDNSSLAYLVMAGIDNLRSQGVGREVVEITIHPDYDDQEKSGDLAVIRLKSPLDYVEGKIENVNLPEYSEIVPLSWGKVAGWGETYDPDEDPDLLKAVDQQVFTQGLCKIFHYYPRSDNMFCAGHFTKFTDSCAGDSGGPFVIGKTLYGVVSSGPTVCVTGPGVYTNVPYFVDWIKEVAKIPN